MNSTIKYPLALAAVFLWLGFVGGISFMEAWLKFKAPGVSLPIGLGIGKLVFNALNKVEWVLFIGIMISLLWPGKNSIEFKNTLILIPAIILILQTFWLLPVLGHRADLYIQNQPVESSNIHFLYIALECLKVISLLVFGILQFKNGSWKN